MIWQLRDHSSLWAPGGRAEEQGVLSWGPEPSQPPHHFYSLLLPAHTSQLASLPVWATRKVLFGQATAGPGSGQITVS